eukprot:CAMPEP_0178439384 /NCGR_PEP_ID=MMETSP0689_2-20121128/36127_1 /TAXON_ID=160604 /ORGANISM="Amphidinium massartii, Strain CS-259" /LENGTH=578 /DNA_ID=CAMNT_0020061909 /DNA_START=55 /DNA_END=1791 /DNA_ORIENTATION=+
MTEEARTENFEAGPVRAATDKYDPSLQVFYEKALSGSWTSYYDLIPDLEGPFMHSCDARKPLTFKALKEFIVSDEVDVPGMKREDRLCTAIPNGPEAAVAFLAFSLRCTFAPLNIGLSRDEFEFEFIDLPAKCLVVQNKESLTEDEQTKSGNAVSVARKAKVEKLMELKPSADVCGLFSLTKHAACRKLEGEKLGNPLPSLKREDLALVLHTSGTTKKPKIVPLTHANICCGAQCIASTVELKAEDICCNTMPLFHIHGQIVNLLASIVAGAQIKCVPGVFHVETFVKALGTEPMPTWYSAVPTMHVQFLHYAEEQQAAGNLPSHKLSLIRNCSAALLPSVAEQMESLFGALIMPTYAMTESMPIASNPRWGVRKLRSVGPVAGPQLQIMKGYPEKDVLPAGEEGEVVVKDGPVTAGYEFREHMDMNPNIEAVDNGWLRTGDKGWLDKDGYLYLSGRFKEIINRAGEKISPFEVEDVIRAHESIKDVIAFAAPSKDLGETVGVCCVLREGKSLTIKELRTWALKSEKLQAKWVPEALVIMPATIPKGPTGKPARINLAKKINMEPLTGMPVDITHEGF